MALFKPAAKKNPLGQNTFTIVILILAAIVTAAMFVGGITSFGETPIVKGNETDPDAFDTSAVYYFDEMVVVDEYAYRYEGSESNITDHYYLIVFSDSEENVYYASMEAKNTADIIDECNAYIEDESMGAGDLVLKGVFTCNDITAKEQDVRSEYSSAYELYSDLLDGKDTGIHFIYEAADEETYHEDAKTDATVLTVMGGVLTLLCIVGIIFAFRQRKKIKADLARVAAASAVPEIPDADNGPTLNQ